MMFIVRHMLISEVPGYFRDWDMKISATKEDWTDATVETVVQTASVNTDNERRDADLRSDNFFNSEKFPEMKFVSTAFEKVGEKKYKIKGNLTIRDITKEVTFDAELLGILNDPRAGTRVGWKATAQINRFDFGLKWNRMIETGGLVVGEMVSIVVNLELIKQTT
jgi:polyisoprenoid-binding protein YceI